MCESPEKESLGGASGTLASAVYVLHYDEVTPSITKLAQAHVHQICQGSPLCVGSGPGDLSGTDEVVTLRGRLLQLLRQFCLHRNEREMLLSEEDQLITVQLCLAELNKKLNGDFDVEVSRVIDYNKRLIKEKLSELTKDTDSDLKQNTSFSERYLNTSFCGSEVDYDTLRTQYEQFLRQTNHLDSMDLVKRISEERRVNSDLADAIISKPLLFLEPPCGRIEAAMLSVLAEGRPVYWVKMEECLGGAGTADSGITAFTQLTSLHEVLTTSSSPAPATQSKGSVTEHHALKLLLGYLQLLVNTRNELALARVINTPERGLDHQAFTDIRHCAETKTLSMYQVMTSFIMKIRVSGKNYVPDDSNKLSTHVKGLGELTDLMHKLSTHIEEVKDQSCALQKVFNVLRTTVLKCPENRLHRQVVEGVRDRLQGQAILACAHTQATHSPKRSAGEGGSMSGRRTLQALRSVLDHYSSLPVSTTTVNLLTDTVSSQHTPLKFPSLLSVFRSPVEHTPEAKEKKSLAQRLREKQVPGKKQSLQISYMGCMDWAQPLHNVNMETDRKSTTYSIDDYAPSITVVHPAPRKQVAASVHAELQLNSTKRLASSENETVPLSDLSPGQENTGIPKTGIPKTKASSTHTTARPTTKRPLADISNNIQPAKRSKVPSGQSQSSQQVKSSKPTNPKGKKKKMQPLQKGQKTLGSYFRI